MHRLICIVFLIPIVAWAAPWEVVLTKQDSWGHHCGISITSENEIDIIIERGKTRRCPKQSIHTILEETKRLIELLPHEYHSYAHLKFNNRCSDNLHYVLVVKDGHHRIKIDYVSGKCHGDAQIPESLSNLVSHLESLEKEFRGCGVKPDAMDNVSTVINTATVDIRECENKN